MFVAAMIGFRWVLVDMLAIDIFDLKSMIARVVWGIACLCVFSSVYKVFTNPIEARRFTDEIVGRKYRKEQMLRAIQAKKDMDVEEAATKRSILQQYEQ